MLDTIIEIAAALRHSGWPVSNEEIVDFFKALRVVSFSREDMFSAALCTLSKDKQSREYLAGMLSRRLQEAITHNEIIPCSLDPEKVLANPPRLPDGAFARRMENLKNSIRRETANLASAPARRGRGGTGGTGVHGDTPGGNRTAAGPVNIKETPVAPAGYRRPSGTQPLPVNPRFMDLAAADREQLAEIYKLLEALGKKLAVRRGYRKKPALSGTVDMQRTVRKAVACGGVPLALKKERRVLSRPLIVTLCDLSGSVAPYSEFFIQLLTGLRRRFKDLRLFAFVDQVAEITSMFNNGTEPVSARKIVRETPISMTGFSHYGQAWESFHSRYREVLSPRITLIILGDARNNWQPDKADIFRSITSLCRRVIWLNPLPREKWQADDCIMDLYAPFCSSVRTCRNADQLSKVIREIL